MRYDYKFRAGGYSSFFPSAVKWLLISNIAIFVISFFTARFEVGQIFNLLALSPELVLKHFAIWQLVTYMFLHAGILHMGRDHREIVGIEGNQFELFGRPHPKTLKKYYFILRVS